MNRRQFSRSSLALSATALSASLVACGPTDISSSATNALKQQPYKDKLGVQLYTLRDLFQKDYKATLQALADIGYKTLEFAGYYDHDPKNVRAHMDALGLKSHSAHIQLADMKDSFDQVVETAQTMGQTYLVLPWISEELRTIDGYKMVANLLNKRGEQAKAVGMKTAYHNHEFEFDIIDGQTPYDILLSETDADLVQMEIDFFWTHKANVDPVTYFKEHPGRFFGCHIKDMNMAGDMVSVGNGTIDFDALLDNSDLAGLEHFYVEHDNPKDALASVRRSFNHLAAL